MGVAHARKAQPSSLCPPGHSVPGGIPRQSKCCSVFALAFPSITGHQDPPRMGGPGLVLLCCMSLRGAAHRSHRVHSAAPSVQPPSCLSPILFVYNSFP